MRFSNTNIVRLIKKIPKILLHTHLEGSIPPSTVTRLAKRNRVHLPFPVRSDTIARIFRSEKWNSFLSTFLLISSCFRNKSDFKDAVLDYARNLVKQNTLYAELHCTPWNHLCCGVKLDKIGEGLYLGIEAAKRECGIDLKVIFDLIRAPDEDVNSILDWMVELPNFYFVALGVSGGLDSLPLEKFEPHCEQAREAGFRIVAHAGELQGANSVYTAVKRLKVDRVIHGVRVIEDRKLFEEMVSDAIHFELCPTSNYILWSWITRISFNKKNADFWSQLFNKYG